MQASFGKDCKPAHMLTLPIFLIFTQSAVKSSSLLLGLSEANLQLAPKELRAAELNGPAQL